jgi:hypothetical protein
MNQSIKETLWKQFGASVDMFENAIKHCPDELWNTESKFWYTAYHTLFFLDYYLTTDPDNFTPPAPYTLSEFNPEGEMPERVYSKEELIDYLSHCRNKLQNLVADLTTENAEHRWINEYRNYSIFEILLYNMRHVQHHTAQLNLLLRQDGNTPPDWVSRTKLSL